MALGSRGSVGEGVGVCEAAALGEGLALAAPLPGVHSAVVTACPGDAPGAALQAVVLVVEVTAPWHPGKL